MSSYYIFQATTDADEFIRQYEDSYYLDHGDHGQLAPNAAGSRYRIEAIIEGILRSGIKSKLDVVYILAWKMSKIRQKSSATEAEYAEDWKVLQGIREEDITPELCVERYGNTFQIGRIASLIFDHISSLEAAAEQSWQTVLAELDALLKGFYGLGPVYLITLVYFISRGAYPIYDQFAMMAVCAIEKDIAPGGSVEYKGLTTVEDLVERDDPEFGYGAYIKRLRALFGAKAKDRRVDRALWVYGHYFNPIKPVFPRR